MAYIQLSQLVSVQIRVCILFLLSDACILRIFKNARSVEDMVFCGGGNLLALLAAVYFFDDSVLKNEELVALSFIWVGVYIIALIFLFFGAEKLKPFICCALILLTCGELVVNGYTDMVGLSKEHKYELRSEYARYDNRIGEAVDFVHERDDGFYRMEKTFSRTDNR